MEVYVKDGDEYKPLPDDHTVLSKSELESKYVTKQEHTDGIESAVQSRFKNHVHKDKVFEDEVLVARFKEQFGTDHKDVDLDAQRKQWETANLRPVREELETTQSQLEKLTGRLRYAEMREKLGTQFNEAFTTRLDPQKPSLAEVMLGDQIEFDVDTSSVKLKGSSMSLEEYAKELAADDKYKPFLREPERNRTDAKIRQDKGQRSEGQPLRRSQMSEDEKRAYQQKYGITRRKDENMPAFKELKL